MANLRRFRIPPERLAEQVRERIVDIAAQLPPGQQLTVRAEHEPDCPCVGDRDLPCACTPELVAGVETVAFLPLGVGDCG